MQFTKGVGPTVTITGQLLDSISEVMSLVESTNIEHENFVEVGCYLHRTSPIIMELHSTENITKNMTDILLSLSETVNHAKQLVRIFSNAAEPVMNTDLKSVIEQLEGAINSIGCDLSSIPSSAFNNNYTELVVQSLSRDMRNMRLPIKRTQPYEIAEPKKENMMIEAIKEGEGKKAEAPVRRKSRRFSSQSSAMPRLVDFLKGVYYGSKENEIHSLVALTDVVAYIEPLYDTFFCPLTRKIMEDPVTIESGVTYERSAINEWFEQNNNEAKAPVCPTTGMKLNNRTLSVNLALKNIIKEWTERNEAARLRVAHKALFLALSEAMVVDAVRDLQVLCRREYNRKHTHNIGITELLTKFLEHNDRKVRSETLRLLQLLVEDDKGKVCDLSS